jgi:protein involved in polysaccharide export with SLBB domain
MLSFVRWIGCFVLPALGVAPLTAAEPEMQPAAQPPIASPESGTNVALSAVASNARGAWQQHLTLGPGDMLNLMLFGEAGSVRTDVPIGPDGRISFLQAHDILAAGLTIDELRAQLDQTLTNYYRRARTIITPAAYRSKKFFVLGAVVTKGVFTMERPVTVIEALARAGGLETTIDNDRTYELADLSRSFMVRDGKRVPLDFEQLFQKGDLAQNLPVEPNDYIYIASSDTSEIYVLGEVLVAGTVRFLPRTTVISAIATRGGFNDYAYKQRVLVVRGSLNHPQTFVVNTASILAGKELDFKLQPKDIVYVHMRPWAKAEDLLHSATVAFLQGMIVQWTSMNIGPFITQPVLPSTR